MFVIIMYIVTAVTVDLCLTGKGFSVAQVLVF